MEAVRSSETSVIFNRAMWRHILQYRILYVFIRNIWKIRGMRLAGHVARKGAKKVYVKGKMEVSSSSGFTTLLV
jgi:hypothetical protein